MSEPWLSILVPFHNVGDYLAECLQSILAQDVSGVEILLLDDASDDASATCAAMLAKAHPACIRLVRNTVNQGVASCRNQLLGLAQGQWLWFVDGDDVLAPGALAALAQVLRQSPELALLMCDYRKFRENPGFKYRLKDSFSVSTFKGAEHGVGELPLRVGLLRAGQLQPWSKIARREIWQRVHFPAGRTYEDIAVLPQLTAGIDHWRHLRSSLVHYRVRAGSIVNSHNPRRMADLLEATCTLRQALRDAPGMQAGQAGRRILDRYCLHRLGTVARWCHESGLSPDCDVAEQIRAAWPEGLPKALAAADGFGWHRLRKRAERRLQRAGWL